METKLSKTLSYFLRHAPGEADLEPGEQGFVRLENVASALQKKGWSKLNVNKLRKKLKDPNVERFEVRGDAVRATYGHSIDVQLEYPEIEPDSSFYHGTSPAAWNKIKTEGLKPMGRRYVHLSRTKEEALRVGRRHHPEPVLLAVLAAKANETRFYRAGPVVLAERVPAKYLRRL